MQRNDFRLALVMAVVLGVACFGTSAMAATYMWTGAVDGDWNNAGNWDANGVPVDVDSGNPGISGPQASSDRIIFNAFGVNPVPTSNIPSLGGEAFAPVSSTPVIDVYNGTLSFSLVGDFGGFLLGGLPLSATVGDGDAGNGTAALTYTAGFSGGILRGLGDGTYTWTVNSDGALTFDDSGSPIPLAYNGGLTNPRYPVFLLNGGSLTFPDAIDMWQSNTNLGNGYFSFQEVGSTLTAKFGGDFPDQATVTNNIGITNLTFRAPENLLLEWSDDGVNWTLTAVSAISPGTLFIFE